MSDGRLTYLLSKLSLNSQSMVPGDGALPDLDTMMAHASLAMGRGHLSEPAYLLGRALYMGDGECERGLMRIAERRVINMRIRHKWPEPATDIYTRYLEERGGMTEAELQWKRDQYFVKFPFLMCHLGYAETKRNSRCQTCNGTGSHEYRVCGSCKGSGNKPMTNAERAAFVMQDRETWRRTWNSRYQRVYTMYQYWLEDFHSKILEACQ